MKEMCAEPGSQAMQGGPGPALSRCFVPGNGRLSLLTSKRRCFFRAQPRQAAVRFLGATTSWREIQKAFWGIGTVRLVIQQPGAANPPKKSCMRRCSRSGPTEMLLCGSCLLLALRPSEQVRVARVIETMGIRSTGRGRVGSHQLSSSRPLKGQFPARDDMEPLRQAFQREPRTRSWVFTWWRVQS